MDPLTIALVIGLPATGFCGWKAFPRKPKGYQVMKGDIEGLKLSGKSIEFKVSKELKKIVNDWPWTITNHPTGEGLVAFRCGDCFMHLRDSLESQAGHLRAFHGYRMNGEKYE